MRILATADIHYDVPRSRASATEMAARICATGGDAVVLVGDTAGRRYDDLRAFLALLGDFRGRKFLVPGNHCLWCLEGETSLERYEARLPALAAQEGFAVLDHAPAVLGRVGLVGSIGWYDYSFREDRLGLPMPYYAAKVAPGAAARLGEHRRLHEDFSGQLAPWQQELTIRWMDGVRCRLGMTDEQFLERLLDRLRGHLEALQADAAVRQVVALTHHVPFQQLLPQGRPPQFAFAAAYMGAARLGGLLLEYPKVTHALCGHSHWPGRCRVGHVQAINIGSTYVEKHLEILDLED